MAEDALARRTTVECDLSESSGSVSGVRSLSFCFLDWILAAALSRLTGKMVNTEKL